MKGGAYEPTDVHGTGILWFAAALLATAIVIFLVVYGLHRYFAATAQVGPQLRRPVSQAATRTSRLSNQVPLQGSPDSRDFGPHELAARRQAEDRILTSYGWVDRSRGIARVPIRAAMRLLVERSAEPHRQGAEEGRP